MKELFPGDTVRDDFQRWLNAGYGPFMIWQGEKALVTISSLEKTPSVRSEEHTSELQSQR